MVNAALSRSKRTKKRNPPSLFPPLPSSGRIEVGVKYLRYLRSPPPIHTFPLIGGRSLSLLVISGRGERFFLLHDLPRVLHVAEDQRFGLELGGAGELADVFDRLQQLPVVR